MIKKRYELIEIDKFGIPGDDDSQTILGIYDTREKAEKELKKYSKNSNPEFDSFSIREVEELD